MGTSSVVGGRADRDRAETRFGRMSRRRYVYLIEFCRRWLEDDGDHQIDVDLVQITTSQPLATVWVKYWGRSLATVLPGGEDNPNYWFEVYRVPVATGAPLKSADRVLRLSLDSHGQLRV